MRLVTEKLPNLEALYIKRLRLLLSVEEQLLRAVPRFEETATAIELKDAIQSHLQETEVQSTRLHEILQRRTGDADLVRCKVAAALIDEAEDRIQDADHDSVRDAALIGVLQAIEHYEIASYGTARQFAESLGLEKEAAILNQTLQEEGHADHLLTEIAGRVNPAARVGVR
jgi:ferritin-like metal-binding protein YciE